MGNSIGMERFKYQAGEQDQGAAALVLGVRAGQYPCGVGLGLGDALQLLEEDIAGAVWVLRAKEASAVRRMCGGAAPDHHGHLASFKVKLLASTYCVAGCAERGHTHLPSAEVDCFYG